MRAVLFSLAWLSAFGHFDDRTVVGNLTRQLQNSACPGRTGYSLCNGNPTKCCPTGQPCCGSDNYCYTYVCGGMCADVPCDCRNMPAMCSYGQYCCSDGTCRSSSAYCPTPSPAPVCCASQCGGASNVCSGSCMGGIQSCVCCGGGSAGTGTGTSASLGLIIGLVVGALVVIAVIVVASICCCRAKTQSPASTPQYFQPPPQAWGIQMVEPVYKVNNPLNGASV
jgi:hypothetical protein